MLQEEIKKIVHQLMHKGIAHLHVNGNKIAISIFEEEATLNLITSVYRGDHYIPMSVRNCLRKELPFQNHFIQTFLTVEEEKFEIFLNYIGVLDNVDRDKFRKLIDEFAWIAEEWRTLLDENDRRDLIHVRVS